MAIDDVEFDDDDLEELGLSLDEDAGPPKRQPPPPAFDPTEMDDDAGGSGGMMMDVEPYSPPTGMPDTKAIEALKNKPLAEPKSSKGLGTGFILILLMVAVPGGFFGFAKFKAYQFEAQFSHIHKEFADKLKELMGPRRVATVGEIKTAVVQLAEARKITIDRSEVHAFGHEIELKYQDTGNTGSEACTAEKPEFWDQMQDYEQKRFETQTAGCNARYVVGYEIEMPKHVFFMKAIARAEGYMVAEDFSEEDDGGPEFWGEE